MSCLDIEKWMECYAGIKRRLALDFSKDEEATRLLFGLLKGHDTIPLKALQSKISGNLVAVHGAGPSLDDGLDLMISAGLYPRYLHLAADGAVSAFMERGRLPDIIFTDLDGPSPDLLSASAQGCWSVIHAHGNNMEILSKLVPQMRGKVLGSTQTRPIPPTVLNLGGFTDGDRSVWWASELGAKMILLIGMDFGTKIGRHSKPDLEGSSLKMKIDKLEIGRELVEMTARKGKLCRLVPSGEPAPLAGVPVFRL